jgi:ABC-type transporter Mla subunit MlaD
MTKQIQINGKAYPVSFGFAALMTFTDATGLTLSDLDQLGENMGLSSAVAMMWAGLKDGARKEKQPFSLSLEDVADLLDGDQDALARVLEVFADSFGEKQPGK